MRESIILFINATKQCNVDCTRCFLYKESRENSQIISQHYLESLLNHPEFQKAKDLTVIWEGGEPTILGQERLSHFVDVVDTLVPHAKQTMVTNLLNAHDWMIDLARDKFNGQIETTFALGKKHTLDGSESRYIEKFKQSLKKVIDSGIKCPINVELNAETHTLGPTALIEIARETGATQWEFDVSIDFGEYNKQQIFDATSYPILPPTINYTQFADYIIEFFKGHASEIKELGIQSSFLSLHDDRVSKDKKAFNVMRELDFFTLNPDGTVTTNPLFSDMPHTFLGNLETHSAEDIVNNPIRRRRARSEISRTSHCIGCEFYDVCQGGPSHVPIVDDTGECAGAKRVWEYLK